MHSMVQLNRDTNKTFLPHSVAFTPASVQMEWPSLAIRRIDAILWARQVESWSLLHCQKCRNVGKQQHD